MLQLDISKTDHWKNVSYRIGSLISNFLEKFDQTDARFLVTAISQTLFDTYILRLTTFSISPMPISIDIYNKRLLLLFKSARVREY
jgi:hypothetical protein